MRILPAPLTEPSGEPVTVDQVKVDARIDGTEFDGVIGDYIAAFRLACEQETGIKLMTQVWRVEAACWPSPDCVIGLGPATAAAITYWDGSSWATLDPSLWVLDRAPGGCVVLPASGVTWPTLPEKAGPRVRIDVTCGFGGASAVPASLKLWIRSHVVAFIDQPGAIAAGAVNPIPHLAGLLDPHRVHAR